MTANSETAQIVVGSVNGAALAYAVIEMVTQGLTFATLLINLIAAVIALYLAVMRMKSNKSEATKPKPGGADD